MEAVWPPKGRNIEGLEVNRDHEGMQPVPSDQIQGDKEESRFLERGEGSNRPRILGLTVATFWIIVVVLVLVLAGGIGGGIGGGLAAQNKNNRVAISSSTSSTSQPTSNPTLTPTSSISSQTSSITSSSTSSAPTSGNSPIIRTPCIDNPSANSSTLVAHSALAGSNIGSFTLLCNTNYPGGDLYGNPDVIDLLRIWVPDMAACVDQCGMYNLGYAVANGNSPKCVVATVVRQEGDYCWLKSATGVNNTETSGKGVPIDSAVLV